MSQSGCEKCQNGVYSGEYSLFEGGSAQPARVADSLTAQAQLHHCTMCGAWWQFNQREAHVIPEQEARSVFADYFASRAGARG